MREPRPRDYAWATFAGMCLVVYVVAVASALWRAVFDGEWLTLVSLPVATAFWWWLGVGAWRRTVWGNHRSTGDYSTVD